VMDALEMQEAVSFVQAESQRAADNANR